MKTAPVLDFLEKYDLGINWHGTCLIIIKSDTLISFLLKKVCFVPQSGPFSIVRFVIPFCIAGNP
jgi:hypothetical protein